MVDLPGRYPTPHPSHALRDVSGGYAAYFGRVCGLPDAYTAIERECAGSRVYACANGGYWQPAFGRQECTETFQTQMLATEHFFARHVEEVARMNTHKQGARASACGGPVTANCQGTGSAFDRDGTRL